jgi:hypothetical protein
MAGDSGCVSGRIVYFQYITNKNRIFNMTDQQMLELFNSPSSLALAIPLIWFMLCVILFFKVWIACSDISDLRKKSSASYDLSQDLQFWARAKYESDRRLGVITEADIAKAESYLNQNSAK